MFTRIMTIILALFMFGTMFLAGYYQGFQNGYKAGAAAKIIEVRYTIIEVMANYIMQKESSMQHVGVWGKLPQDQKHPTYGIAQFQKRTFYWMARMAGLQKPDWKDKEQQEWLLKWALQNGYGSHWGKNYVNALKVATASVLNTQYALQKCEATCRSPQRIVL